MEKSSEKLVAHNYTFESIAHSAHTHEYKVTRSSMSSLYFKALCLFIFVIFLFSSVLGILLLIVSYLLYFQRIKSGKNFV